MAFFLYGIPAVHMLDFYYDWLSIGLFCNHDKYCKASTPTHAPTFSWAPMVLQRLKNPTWKTQKQRETTFSKLGGKIKHCRICTLISMQQEIPQKCFFLRCPLIELFSGSYQLNKSQCCILYVHTILNNIEHVVIHAEFWNLNLRLHLRFDLVVSKAEVLEVGSGVGLDRWELMLQHLDHLRQLWIPPAELPTETKR